MQAGQQEAKPTPHPLNPTCEPCPAMLPEAQKAVRRKPEVYTDPGIVGARERCATDAYSPFFFFFFFFVLCGISASVAATGGRSRAAVCSRSWRRRRRTTPK
jgi:hypothetical protein